MAYQLPQRTSDPQTLRVLPVIFLIACCICQQPLPGKNFPAKLIRSKAPFKELIDPPKYPAKLSSSDLATQNHVYESFSKLPLSFQSNEGQLNAKVKYYARGDGYSLFLTASETVLSLSNPLPQRRCQSQAKIRTPSERQSARSRTVVQMKLLGSNPEPQIQGKDELPVKVNYFIGNDASKWRAVSSYGKVEYQNVYPGIGLIYYGNPGQLEYDFVVATGANPDLIKLGFEGAQRISIDANGDLILFTTSGEVRMHRPVIYQESAGDKQQIPGHFVLKGRHQVGFEVAAYDHDKPLIIDPALSYSTYLGGGGYERSYGIAVDSAGNAYITGETLSGDFPTQNGYASGQGAEDVFIAKINTNAEGNASLLYSTYLGSGSRDYSYAITADNAGNAYVTGQGGGDFPITPNAFQSTSQSIDAFVAKLNTNASGAASLVYSSFLGGSGTDRGAGIAVAANGDVYVAGFTGSTNFPTLGSYQVFQGVEDVFLTKLNINVAGTAGLLYSTLLGGSEAEEATSLAIDSSGNAYIAGYTYSTNLPLKNALQTSFQGGVFDGFVAKLNTNATGTAALLYSTYLGTAGWDQAHGIAADAAGNAYITGSAGDGFPTKNGYQMTHQGGTFDVFVTKLDTNAIGAASLLYSTFLGSGGDEGGYAIAADATGIAYVTGSAGLGFPARDAYQTLQGPVDAFVAKLNTNLTGDASLLLSTYFGGREGEAGTGIAFDPTGNIYVTGFTDSTDLPTVRAYQDIIHPSPFPEGGFVAHDVFVAKFVSCLAPVISLQPNAQTACNGASVTFTAAASDSPEPTTIKWQVSSNGGPFADIPGATTQSLTFTVNAAQNGNLYRAVFTNSCVQRPTNYVPLTVNVASSVTVNPTNQVACEGSGATFTAAAVGNPTPTVQWQVKASGTEVFTDIPGAIYPELGFAAYAEDHGNQYRAVFTNLCGAVTTAAATLAINTFTLTPPGQTFSASGGMGSFTVTSEACVWTPISPFPWITNLARPFGGATVIYTVAANPDTVPRTGWILIGARYFTIEQFGIRQVRVVNTNAIAGSTVNVPIELIANGDENALSFSLNFSTALFSNSQVTLGSDAALASLNLNTSQLGQGRLGVALALPPGQTFAAGVRQLARVSFAVSTSTPTMAVLDFGDQPIVRQVVNVNAIPLPTSFSGGNVMVTTNFEADIAPRGSTDGILTVADWVQAGRFATGIDTASVGQEFRRADCAPRNTLGDGLISITDWAQAGRYAAGLDPPTPAGGPTSPVMGPIANLPFEPALARTVRAVSASFVRGQINSLLVQLDAQGNENTLGFSLNYDPGLLGFVSASTGSGASGALLVVNPNQTASGRIGIGLALPGGQHFAAGTQAIVTLSFTVAAGGPTVATQVSFGDQPTQRQVADINANAISATYTNAVVTILQDGCSYSLNSAGQSFATEGGLGSFNVLTGSGCGWTAVSSAGFITITSGEIGNGNGAVTFEVAANIGAARAGAITVAGLVFAIEQAGLGLQFYPLPSPVRLLDTRSGGEISGCTTSAGALAAGSTRTQAARTACSTIPANATAVIGNITVVPSGPGFLTLFPSDATQPTVANSNFKAGEVTNNFFTVGLGTDGAFKIFTSAATDVIIDLTGYYAPPSPSGLYYHPLPAPVRLVQTFPGQTGCFANPTVTQLQGTNDPNANPALDLVVEGRGAGLPSPCNSIPSDAVVLVGNATTVFPNAPFGFGYLTIYPSDASRPTVASSNYGSGDIINGPFAVKLGADGKFKVYTFSTTHLVIDISGYYSTSPNDASGAGLLFNPLPKPMRLLETRNIPGFPLVGCYKPQAPIAGGTGGIRTQQVWGTCSDQPITIPNTSQAIVGNVTAINPTGAGFGTFFPGNVGTAPTVAVTNYPFPAVFGYNRHYYVGLSPTDGTFKILTQFTSDYVVDVSGYFAP